MPNNPRLLLVEDDLELLEVLTRAMARRGCTVIGCSDYEQALIACQEQSIDVAVVDGNVNQRDGFTLVYDLLQLRPALRAIVLSGRVDQQARNRSREVGACAFLSKPCSLSDLRATIERVLFGDVQDGISTAQA